MNLQGSPWLLQAYVWALGSLASTVSGTSRAIKLFSRSIQPTNRDSSNNLEYHQAKLMGLDRCNSDSDTVVAATSLQNRRLNAEAFPHHAVESAKLGNFHSSKLCLHLSWLANQLFLGIFRDCKAGYSSKFSSGRSSIICFIHVIEARVPNLPCSLLARGLLTG